MTRAFWGYPICRGPLDQSDSGSGHTSTRAQATLQLAINELQYVLQYLVINKLFANKQIDLVILLHFSVALAQNTTGLTTATTMAAAGGNGPLMPHMRPCAPCQCFKWMDDNPPSLRTFFGGGWGCVWPSKCSFVPAMMNCHNIGVFWGPYTPSTAPKIIPACSAACRPSIRHVGMERKASCGALGGHFRQWWPWSAMVVLVDVGHWRLTSGQPTVGIVWIVYRSIFLFLRRSHTFLTSDPAAK